MFNRVQTDEVLLFYSSFKNLLANETSPRVLNCPSNILSVVESGEDFTVVTWIEPYAINMSPAAKISSTHKPKDTFPIGTTPVMYTFKDKDGFEEFCNFTVTVIKNGKMQCYNLIDNSFAKSRHPSCFPLFL